MGRVLFGTDGIRGIANRHPMTADLALRLGRAICHVLKARGKKGAILIGKDTRLSGYMLETALASGICSMGCEPVLLGPMPTAAVAFLTRQMLADAGVVVSASHNPYEYNGIKVFSSLGFKLSDELEEEIESFLDLDASSLCSPEEMGKARRLEDGIGRYAEFLKGLFPHSLDGMRIVLDCANGATYRVAPLVFEEIGAETIACEVDPDGFNINRACGTEHPHRIRDLVKEHKADLGIAFDGDGDRVMLVDGEGEIFTGDSLMAIIASFLKERSLLKGDAVVGTVMSNMGLERFLSEKGMRLIRTKVGDRYVIEEMLRSDLNLGGERSGHIVLLDHTTTGDGIVTALKVLEIMVEKGKTLKELKGSYREYPQVESSVKVREKRPLTEVPALLKMMEEVQNMLGERGRLVVRYSGTEDVLRIMLEGEDEKELLEYAKGLEELAKECL
jgi:phosphoglucosamine mutase